MTQTEVPMDEDGRLELLDMIQDGVWCLSELVELPAKPTPKEYVDGIFTFVELVRAGKHPESFGDMEQIAYVVGSVFGDALSQQFGWEWIYVEDEFDERLFGLVSPDRSYLICPHFHIYAQLAEPQRNNNARLIFDMIAHNQLPKVEPGTYSMLV